MVKQTPAQGSTPLKENHLSGSAGGPKFPRSAVPASRSLGLRPYRASRHHPPDSDPLNIICCGFAFTLHLERA